VTEPLAWTTHAPLIFGFSESQQSYSRVTAVIDGC